MPRPAVALGKAIVLGQDRLLQRDGRAVTIGVGVRVIVLVVMMAMAMAVVVTMLVAMMMLVRSDGLALATCQIGQRRLDVVGAAASGAH
jgi:hypothetical protein